MGRALLLLATDNQQVEEEGGTSHQQSPGLWVEDPRCGVQVCSVRRRGGEPRTLMGPGLRKSSLTTSLLPAQPYCIFIC